jgi:hypothetical protein
MLPFIQPAVSMSEPGEPMALCWEVWIGLDAHPPERWEYVVVRIEAGLFQHQARFQNSFNRIQWLIRSGASTTCP